MIISKAPLRLGIAGGGTDIEEFINIEGGLVLNSTINLFAYSFIEKSDEDTFISIDYSESGSSKDLGFSSKKYLQYAYQVKMFVDKNLTLKPEKLKISTYSEVPHGSGLGSSSALVVSLLEGLRRFYSLSLTKYELAEYAFHIERKIMNQSGGKQDQYSAVFGGVNYIEFNKESTIVNPLKIDSKFLNTLESSMVSFFQGQSRDSGKIINDQKINIKDKIDGFKKIKKDASKIKNAFINNDMTELNKLLNIAWEHKKATSSLIANNRILDLFDNIKSRGASSAKISGAGGGGFALIFCPPYLKHGLVNYLKTQGEVYNINFYNKGVISWKVK